MSKLKKVKCRRAPDKTYRSGVEKRFAATLDKMKSQGLIRWWGYECMRFYLPGGKVKYMPDFCVIETATDEMVFYEIKQSWRQKGAASTRKSLKIVAATYPMFSWFGVTPGKKKSDPEWIWEEF